MELKLNFPLGHKTVNGRYYDPDMLKQQFTNFLEKSGTIPIGPDSRQINESDGSVPEDRLVGRCQSYRVDDDGTMFLDIIDMSEATETYLKNNPDVVKLSIFGFGNMDESKVVRDFKLTCLFMTMDA